jgi:hypothetical protein
MTLVGLDGQGLGPMYILVAVGVAFLRAASASTRWPDADPFGYSGGLDRAYRTQGRTQVLKAVLRVVRAQSWPPKVAAA